MNEWSRPWVVGVWLAVAAGYAQGSDLPHPVPSQSQVVPDTQQLERQLQGLNWEQFQRVVKAVPKLRAQVDAYGPLGWQYVQMNYQTHNWRKSIDKLDASQKQDLQALIRKAQGTRPPVPGAEEGR